MDAKSIVTTPLRLAFATAGAAMSAVEGGIAVTRFAVQNVESEVKSALHVENSDLTGAAPMQLLQRLTSLLEPDRPIGIVIARGGPLDRVLQPGGAVDRLTEHGGILDKLTAPGGLFDKLTSDSGMVSRLISDGGPLDRLTREGGVAGSDHPE